VAGGETYTDGIGLTRCAVCLELMPCSATAQHKGIVMFDVKCMDLAVLFLEELPPPIATNKDVIGRVAQAIQDAAESAVEDERVRAVAAMDAKAKGGDV
jgi:hypothetical protein